MAELAGMSSGTFALELPPTSDINFLSPACWTGKKSGVIKCQTPGRVTCGSGARNPVARSRLARYTCYALGFSGSSPLSPLPLTCRRSVVLPLLPLPLSFSVSPPASQTSYLLARLLLNALASDRLSRRSFGTAR